MVSFVDEFTPEEEEQSSNNQPCNNFRSDDCCDEGSEDGGEHCHNSKSAKRTNENNKLVIFHCHDHSQEKGFVTDLTDQDGDEREHEGGAIGMLSSLLHLLSEGVDGVGIKEQGAHKKLYITWLRGGFKESNIEFI